jgi:hypothetical protein
LRNEAIIANIAAKINRESVERENIDGLFKISFIGLFVIGNCRPIGGDSGRRPQKASPGRSCQKSLIFD